MARWTPLVRIRGRSMQPSLRTGDLLLMRPARRITMVACLRAGKRIDVLIAAAPRILARHPDIEIQIVGDGPCREKLVALARSTGVSPHVQFMGHRDDVPAILTASDLFVLPSASEASPNVVLEAMAAGLPVVASRVGGIPEIVDDGVTGHLAKVAFERAAEKLPIKVKVVARLGESMVEED